MSATCLIGWTGFVGGNLARQVAFDEQVNSRTIEQIKGRRFSALYCAGVRAAKWIANRQPREDLEQIVVLLDALRDVEVERFVLISTVDVYRDPFNVDEETRIVTEGLHPYGTHRRMVETFVAERFPRHHIIRLPGLFGRGLKKNFIFDMINGRPVDGFHPAAAFQFYNLEWLSADIAKVIAAELPLVNFATEPVTVAELAGAVFERRLDAHPSASPVSYDMHTRHAGLWGEAGGYLYRKARVIDEIARFVAMTPAAAE